MNQLLLTPTDVLFFRDGRPMSGSLCGHGAAWPLPSVTNAALHAALHRASIQGVHTHRRGRSGLYSENDAHRDRKFGSLVTAGPFPVMKDGTWLFPRPLDSGVDDGDNETTAATFLPISIDSDSSSSSLPSPLKHPLANRYGPTKKAASPWWDAAAWKSYIDESCTAPKGFKDGDFSDTESCFGIGIDPDTGTQDGERFYSAHYLRLRDGCRLGLLASAHDKDFRDIGGNSDLIATLFPESGKETPIIAGGQQRICTVLRNNHGVLPLPLGKSLNFATSGDQHLVKWVLLSPAVFPKIGGHGGGWLPSWINGSGDVQLLDGPGKNCARRHNVKEGKKIPATLVAAMVGKPIPVTGYALDSGLDDRPPGPKPTFLAVPAGSVYYFSCPSAEAAVNLAAALNWHGAETTPFNILNRRSTLFGEKGFGLGVCGTWQFHDGRIPANSPS